MVNATHCYLIGPIVSNHLETTFLVFTSRMIYKILILSPTNLFDQYFISFIVILIKITIASRSNRNYMLQPKFMQNPHSLVITVGTRCEKSNRSSCSYIF